MTIIDKIKCFISRFTNMKIKAGTTVSNDHFNIKRKQPYRPSNLTSKYKIIEDLSEFELYGTRIKPSTNEVYHILIHVGTGIKLKIPDNLFKVMFVRL